MPRSIVKVRQAGFAASLTIKAEWVYPPTLQEPMDGQSPSSEMAIKATGSMWIRKVCKASAFAVCITRVTSFVGNSSGQRASASFLAALRTRNG
ncbi:MAG: hypothetical protein IPM53_28405 [Anaerolineaceae bacterium]|nr:hypothetical protein [Anaerolineaceae bacterium]